MSALELEQALEAHLGSVAASATGSKTEATIGGIESFIVDWLKKAQVLPSKEEVLKIASDAFDKYVATRPWFAAHPLASKLAKMGLLAAIGLAYDQLG